MEKKSSLKKRGRPKKNPGGAPPKYSSVTVLQKKIDEYFEKCDKGEIIQALNRKGEVYEIIRKIPYTVPGLAYHLGFANRHSVWDYKQRPKFTNTITRALLKIQAQRNEGALTGTHDSKFSQFDLKENFGWKDTQNIKVDGLDDIADRIKNSRNGPITKKNK